MHLWLLCDNFWHRWVIVYCSELWFILLDFLGEKNFARLDNLKLIVDVLQMTFVFKWALIWLNFSSLVNLWCASWTSTYFLMIVLSWGWFTPWWIPYLSRLMALIVKRARVSTLSCCVHWLALNTHVWPLLVHVACTHQVGIFRGRENWVLRYDIGPSLFWSLRVQGCILSILL